MQTLLLKVEDSAMDKVMWMLEHLKDVVKIEKYVSFEEGLLDDLQALQSGTLKTKTIEDIQAHINTLKK